MSRHVTCLNDRETCDQIVLKELRSKGLQPKLETPKPAKRSLVPFSTPGSSNTPAPQGRVFGKRLTELSNLFVEVDEQSDIFVPKFVVQACTYIEQHINSVGVYRLSGSTARQKNIRRELESTEIELDHVSPCPSVLDVASLLKQFIRELPLPVIPSYLHSVLVEALSKDESSLLLCLLLLPSLHLSCLTYLARHLAKISDNSEVNKMTASNLAIVLTPSLFPQEKLVAGAIKDKKISTGDKDLKAHTAIVEAIIKNALKIGFLPENLYERYTASLSNKGYSTSEDNLDEECGAGPSERKSKKRQRRRSGSLSRVLSVVNKGIRAMARSNTPSRTTESVHNTPSAYSHTPDLQSPPRMYSTKRKATGEHKQSPSTKSQKRAFESTFTPKMRTRTFSMKKFKKKKSEAKQLHHKETFKAHTDLALTPALLESQREGKVVARRVSPRLAAAASKSAQASPSTSTATFDLSSTVDLSSTQEEKMDADDQNETYTGSQFESDYAEMKAEYQQLKVETARLEANLQDVSREDLGDVDINTVEQRYQAALANGTLNTEPRQATKKLDQVKRKSSEGRKPRSPSQRRIGVMRRRSKEEQRGGGGSGGSGEESPGCSPRERGRSTAPRYTVNRASPNTKVPLTPRLGDTEIKGRLARGRPNSASSGLEKPSASPVLMPGPNGKVIIKHSFRKERPRPGEPVRTSTKTSSSSSETEQQTSSSPGVETRRSMRRQNESIKKLRQDIEELIEKSFGDNDNQRHDSQSSAMEEDVFTDTIDGGTGTDNNDKQEMFEISSRMANVSFSKLIDLSSSEVSHSPVTRSQLRRQSSAFEFVKPEPMVATRENMRRQSSAFEFRSSTVEPIYENLTRDVSSRASLRRRNSSVKDLIKKMENEARRRIASAPVFDFKSGKKPARISEEAPVYVNLEEDNNDVITFAMPQNPDKVETQAPVGPAVQVLETDLDLADGGSQVTPTKEEEVWTDGTDFFNNLALPLPSHVPQCGRSSIVKIRKENRGRVLDSVNKFSNMTPVRGGGGRPSTAARMGVCASPALHAPPAASTRRQTLTGIRTSIGGVPAKSQMGHTPGSKLHMPHTPRTKTSLPPPSSAHKSRLSTSGARHHLPPTPSGKHYAAPTAASKNRMRDKSPSSQQLTAKSMKPRKSPSTTTYSTYVIKKKKSPGMVPKSKVDHQAVESGSGSSSSKGKQTVNVKRSTSSGVSKKTVVVNRNRDRRKDKRFLTIGYPDEIRSPLKECQNIHANIKRSNSDQSSGTKVSIKTRSSQQQQEDQMATMVHQIQVTRNRSLKSDAMMSPAIGTRRQSDRYLTPGATDRVRRAHSDRSTPRKHPYKSRLEMKGGQLHKLESGSTPRKSPKLSHLI